MPAVSSMTVEFELRRNETKWNGNITTTLRTKWIAFAFAYEIEWMMTIFNFNFIFLFFLFHKIVIFRIFCEIHVYKMNLRGNASETGHNGWCWCWQRFFWSEKYFSFDAIFGDNANAANTTRTSIEEHRVQNCCRDEMRQIINWGFRCFDQKSNSYFCAQNQRHRHETSSHGMIREWNHAHMSCPNRQ